MADTSRCAQLSGNNLTDFDHSWYNVIKEIRVRPDDDSRVEMLTTQMKKSSVLTDDMTYFENLPVNHQDKTYIWLTSMMQKHIHKHKEKNLQREVEHRKGRLHMTLLGDAKHSNGYII